MESTPRAEREILMLLRNVPYRGFQSREIADLLLFDLEEIRTSLRRLTRKKLVIQKGESYFLTDEHERVRWLDELLTLGLAAAEK